MKREELQDCMTVDFMSDDGKYYCGKIVPDSFGDNCCIVLVKGTNQRVLIDYDNLLPHDMWRFDDEREAFYKPFHDKQDVHNKEYLKKHLIKGCTKEQMSDEELEFFYNDFIKPKLLYHSPEDGELMRVVIDTYNYLNKWK